MNALSRLLLVGGLGLFGFGVGVAWWWTDPERVLDRFYSFGSEGELAPEALLKDPLILGGPRVAPFVAEAIRSPDMPRRRYAISYLGNGEHEEAIPALLAILRDAGEKDYFRADALKAMYRIDSHAAKRAVEGLGESTRLRQENADCCTRLLQAYVACVRADRVPTHWKDRRTYWDALFGRE